LTLAKQIKNWFNNRGRRAESAKAGRGDLKLDTNVKRKLAPLQAYCSHAWETTLKPIVLTRWEQQKTSTTFADDDDPSEDADGAPAEACIPLAFKLKIAKELFDGLTQEEKDEIDVRREEDWKKLYRKIPKIDDEGERIAKLMIHKKYVFFADVTNLPNVFGLFRNQPLVSKSLLRILANLEDLAGCATQLFIVSVNPKDGAPTVQKYVLANNPYHLLTFV
jgi:hypothetical protein